MNSGLVLRRSRACRSRRAVGKRRSLRPLLVFDRDGTLMEEKGYLRDPAGVRLLPGVAAGLRRLRRAGYPVIVVSNQSGVGRGLMTEADVRKVNRRFLQMLRSRGAGVDGLFWCPHGPGEGCGCRKPGLALVKRAAREVGCSWRGAISVGDRVSDVALGRKTGGFGVLVLTGYGPRALAHFDEQKPDFVARDFGQAVEWIRKGQKSWQRK